MLAPFSLFKIFAPDTEGVMPNPAQILRAELELRVESLGEVHT